MREIKFRFWHQIDMRIYEVHGVDFVNKWVHWMNTKMKFNTGYLMQYTGLKDKNGTELYEGDIVKAKTINGVEFVGIVSYHQSFCQFFVETEDDLHGIMDDMIGDMDIFAHEAEVMGNIFENRKMVPKRLIDISNLFAS